MKKNAVVCCLFLFVSFVSASFAYANSQMRVSPLGFEIGKAKYQYIKDKFEDKILLKDLNSNRYTGGRVLQSEAPEFLGVKGLRGLRFIFDTNENLSAVVMQIDKMGERLEEGSYAGFLNVFTMLQEKYDLLSKDLNPRKAAMKAQFRGGNNTYIQMFAPKNNSIFELRYLSNDFIVKREQIIQAQNDNVGYISSDNNSNTTLASRNVY